MHLYNIWIDTKIEVIVASPMAGIELTISILW